MPTARSTLVLAAASLVAGAAFDSTPLYVPGFALILLYAGARIWVGLAARDARLEREPGPSTIVEGESYALLVTVRSGRMPLPGGRILHPLAETSGPIGVRSQRRIMLEVPALRRGRHELGPVTLEISDPLHLHTVGRRAGDGDQVLVLPRIEPVRARSNGAASGGDWGAGPEGLGTGGLDTRSIDFEIDGIRPHRDGSPASRIHWPTVARIGELVEHRLVAGADSSPLVVLDSSSPDDEDALDRAVRAAASLCVHLAPGEGCALLLSGERRPHEIDPSLRNWPQAHARLALVEGGGPQPALAAVARRPGAVFWVTASTSARVSEGPIGGPGFVVAPSAPTAGAPLTVAGCDIRRLGAPPLAARRARAA